MIVPSREPTAFAERHHVVRRGWAALTVVVLLCGACAHGAITRRVVASPVPTTTSSSTTSTTSTTVPLVPWTGPVEHIFFHTLVIDPELAFTHDKLGQGFADYFVTVGEFQAILEQLYANGWTLVDIHRAVAGDVEVPAGRKPLVISEDDVNYYTYETGRGLGARLVVDPSGRVMVAEPGGQITDNDLVPMVDEFV